MATQFQKILTEAINHFVENGYTDQNALEYWLTLLRRAAIQSLVPEDVIRQNVAGTLRSLYRREVERGGILKNHRGMGIGTLNRLRPELENELQKRLAANVSLIKLNRERVVAQTLDRFAGWATSVPEGGTPIPQRNHVKAAVKKGLSGLPFEERRVAIDQGHKFLNAINTVVAEGGGAIGAIWHSHWQQPGYNYRPDHKERDLKFYLLRDSWAIQKGLVKVGPDGYSDSITQPAEEPFCRCFWQFVYSLKDVPDDCLTERGHEILIGAMRFTA